MNKRILAILAGLVLASAAAHAQNNPGVYQAALVRYEASTPVGGCTEPHLWIDTSTDHLWACKAGIWTDLTAAGGVSWPLLAPTTADCSAPSYGVTGGDAGLCATAANTVQLANRFVTANRSRLFLTSGSSFWFSHDGSSVGSGISLGTSPQQIVFSVANTTRLTLSSTSLLSSSLPIINLRGTDGTNFSALILDEDGPLGQWVSSNGSQTYNWSLSPTQFAGVLSGATTTTPYFNLEDAAGTFLRFTDVADTNKVITFSQDTSSQTVTVTVTDGTASGSLSMSPSAFNVSGDDGTGNTAGFTLNGPNQTIVLYNSLGVETRYPFRVGLTDAVAGNVFAFDVADIPTGGATAGGGTLSYQVNVRRTDEAQTESGFASWAVVYDGTTATCQIDKTGTPTALLSAGTLSLTLACGISGTVATFTATADTDLASVVIEFKGTAVTSENVSLLP